MNTRCSKIWPLLIIYGAISIIFIGALLIAVEFSTSSYLSLVNNIIVTLHRPDLKPLITETLFPEKKYLDIYKFHWFIYPLIIAISVALYARAKQLLQGILRSWIYTKLSLSHFTTFFNSLPKKNKLLVAFTSILYLVIILYNNHLKPISYDEAWGYNYYISKPFYFPIILFNTYPLFNVITHLFTFLPFDTLFNIRLPSLLFGLLSLLTLYYTLSKKIGFPFAGLAILLLAAAPLFYIYSSLSRGITLSLFISIVVFHVVLQLVNETSSPSRHKFLYIVANFLGIISMPTFFVYTICNTVFLLYKKYNDKTFIRQLVTSTSIICFLSLLFYLPVILNSGVSLLKHNDHYFFKFSDTIQNLSTFQIGLSNLFFGSKYIAIFLAVLAIILWLFKHLTHTIRELVRYSAIILVCSLVVRFATGNIFPERSLNYLIICFIVFAISIASSILPTLHKNLKTFLQYLFLLFLLYSIARNQRELLSPTEDKDAKAVAAVLLSNDVNTVYIDAEDFWLRVPMIEYYYFQAHKNVSFTTSVKSSTRYKPLHENQQYDCIITNPIRPLNISSNSYLEMFRTNSFVLWRRL